MDTVQRFNSTTEVVPLNATNVTKSLKLLVPTSSAIQFTLGVLGNLIAMFVLLKNANEHKWRTFYRLVASLVITDLCGILTTSPVTFVMYVTKFKWPNDWLCDYMSLLMIFASMATMFIVAAMSLDRFVAVCYPFYYGSFMKTRRTNCTTAGLWIHCVEADDRGIYNGHHKMADSEEGKFCFDSFDDLYAFSVWCVNVDKTQLLL